MSSIAVPGAVRYRIKHTTTYRYEEPVNIALNEARLSPRGFELQQVHSAKLHVDPPPAFMSRDDDYFGNAVHRFALQDPHHTFTLTSVSEVTVLPAVAPLPSSTPAWERVRDQLRDCAGAQELEARRYCFESEHVQWEPALQQYALLSFTAGRPLLEAALDLNHRVYTDYTYDPGATSIATPLSEVVSLKRGVCQDFAHLMIACLRSIGLSARYVSGYLRTMPSPGQPLNVGADATHAWLAIYCPDVGFVGLDPTNDKLTSTDHATIAWGRDFADVSPLKGVVVGGGSHIVEVGVSVTPLSGE